MKDLTDLLANLKKLRILAEGLAQRATVNGVASAWQLATSQVPQGCSRTTALCFYEGYRHRSQMYINTISKLYLLKLAAMDSLEGDMVLKDMV